MASLPLIIRAAEISWSPRPMIAYKQSTTSTAGHLAGGQSHHHDWWWRARFPRPLHGALLSRQRLGSARLGSTVAAQRFTGALHTKTRADLTQDSYLHIAACRRSLCVLGHSRIQLALALPARRARSPAARLFQQVIPRHPLGTDSRFRSF